KMHIPVTQDRHGICQITALKILPKFLPQVEEMDISWNELIGGSLTALTSHLQHVGEVRTLRLCSCRLNSEDVVALGGSLRCLPSVGELDLSCNKLLAGGLSRLTFHLAHVTHLERLDLHLCCLTRDDLEALIQVLPSLTALTELDVSSNKEVGGVVHSLVSALPVTQMRRLPFNSCYLSNESFTALGNTHTHTHTCLPEMVKLCVYASALAVPYLRTVDISWCKVVGGHLALLLDALQPSVVSELHLCSCELTTDDMQHLAAVCRRGCLSSLRALDLSYNSSVGDNGWCSLFAAGGLGSLEDVDVSLRPSTSAPCSAWLPALLRALPQMPALARLAVQRWTADCQEGEQLRYCLKKRSFYVPLLSHCH
uniref:Leucine rich repeat containing 31 n=1 Tax=Neolamprologus brichardi TaxID=32507 RepID=A0A3Q4GR38_NEOBR